MSEEKEKEETPPTCQDCGAQDETVSETTCPFQSEIHDKEVPIVVCQKCYLERLYDI